MIKNASRLWGFPDTQAESSFDPVVGLILGALSSELARISADINTVETRILEKLVDLLTPEPVTGPFPAHAIVKAKAAEPKLTISPTYQFYLNKRQVIQGEQKATERQVFFTPTGNHQIFNGEMKYIISSWRMFGIEEELNKEVLAYGRNQSRHTSELWFGIELDPTLEVLDGLSFCFNLKNETFEESFYDALSKGKWTIGGEKALFSPGFPESQNGANNKQKLPETESDLTSKVTDHIHRFYANRFQTLTTKNFKRPESEEDQDIPEALYNYYSAADLQKLEKGLVWIRVQFPQVLASEVIDDLICSINCFPVFNRRLVEFTQSSRQYINIIPLITEDIFFDMKQVTGNSGQPFISNRFSGINQIEQGSYILRNGGVGRFDSRNAAEIISYLLELLRDESAAFSILGADMIASDLRELNQTITRLEHRLKSSNVIKREVPYLLLKSQTEESDTLFVEFWTTNGEFANKIKNGQKLFVYEGSGIWPESVMSVTPTVGGRERMDTEERINAYRKALLSHGRVVTQEDIKALCFEHFGNKIKGVEIKKGLQAGKNTNSGIFQTIDIYISLFPSSETYDSEEIEFLRQDLLVKLEEQSSNYLPFRCFMNGA